MNTQDISIKDTFSDKLTNLVYLYMGKMEEGQRLLKKGRLPKQCKQASPRAALSVGFSCR